MGIILRTDELYDYSSEGSFGYIGINVETRKVGTYSDSSRRGKNNGLVYPISPDDEDFYYDFLHNGKCLRLGFSSLTDDKKGIVLKLLEKQIEFAKSKGYPVGDIEKIFNTFMLVKGSYIGATIPFYNYLSNSIALPNLDRFVKTTEEEYVPTEEEISEYNALIWDVEYYCRYSWMSTSSPRKEMEHKEKIEKLRSKKMQKIAEYLAGKKQEKKDDIYNASVLLFALGQARVSSLTVDTEERKAISKVGFYESFSPIYDIRLTTDGDQFIETGTWRRNGGMVLEMVINDLECRDIDPNYRSVIPQKYGPLLDFITEGRLREARYNGGIEEFHRIMCDIIPDLEKSKQLLDAMDVVYDGSCSDEVISILNGYAEARIEQLNLTGIELYNYCKKCKELGANSIKQSDQNFKEYMATRPDSKRILDLLMKIKRFNDFGGKLGELGEIEKAIEEYAKNNPDNLEIQLLNIFIKKYYNQQRQEALGRNISIGTMTIMILSDINMEAVDTYCEDGTILRDKYGRSKKEIQRIEDRFSVFLPEDLKTSLIEGKDDMLQQMINIFGVNNNLSPASRIKQKVIEMFGKKVAK